MALSVGRIERGFHVRGQALVGGLSLGDVVIDELAEVGVDRGDARVALAASLRSRLCHRKAQGRELTRQRVGVRQAGEAVEHPAKAEHLFPGRCGRGLAGVRATSDGCIGETGCERQRIDIAVGAGFHSGLLWRGGSVLFG